jgi:uncharacterized membrane protein HdeD (DUF308 family)
VVLHYNVHAFANLGEDAMIKAVNSKFLMAYAAFVVGLMANAGSAEASGNNFSDIARNISASVEELPGMVSAFAYLFGLLLGVMGILKLKDHVENPSNTPLKDGAIRLAAGGALFALPIVMEAMQETIGATTRNVGPAKLNKVEFHVR